MKTKPMELINENNIIKEVVQTDIENLKQRRNSIVEQINMLEDQVIVEQDKLAAFDAAITNANIKL